jgi:CheY-specific phosphatase CheX
MNTLLNRALYGATAMVFEELGFMLTNPDLEEHQVSLPAQTSVSVSFQGPLQGALLITVFGDLLPTLAANMLGEDDASERQQWDALGEIANVICGNLLPSIAGLKAVFKLAAPAARPGEWQPDDEVWELGQRVAQAQIGLEDGRADVILLAIGGIDCLPERFRGDATEDSGD